MQRFAAKLLYTHSRTADVMTITRAARTPFRGVGKGLTLLDAIPAERELALGSLRRALAGLPEPADGSPGWPRHPQGRPPSPEERATPRARTGASQLSIYRHGMSAVESPVPVHRHVMPLRPTARFGGSNGPSKGQRAVTLPVRLARRLSLAWSAGQPSRP